MLRYMETLTEEIEIGLVMLASVMERELVVISPVILMMTFISLRAAVIY